MGEGWARQLRHGATGAAQIVPDHTACGELWRGHAEPIPPARSYVPEFSPREMGKPTPEDVVEALYRDPVNRQELARAAVSVAQNSAYLLDAVMMQFDELFVGLAGDTEMEAS